MDNQTSQDKNRGGRPSKYGEKTKPIRVPVWVDEEKILPALRAMAILRKWDWLLQLKGVKTRYYFLAKAINEIHDETGQLHEHDLK